MQARAPALIRDPENCDGHDVFLAIRQALFGPPGAASCMVSQGWRPTFLG